MRDMVEIRGSYSQVMARDFYEGTSYREDYTHVILTDEEEVPEAIGKLRSVYRNLMKMDYDNSLSLIHISWKASRMTVCWSILCIPWASSSGALP